MAAKRKRYQYQNNYIDGNTARKHNYVEQIPMQDYNVAPDRQRRQEPAPQRREPDPRRQVQRQPRSLNGIGKASLFVLTMAIVATLYFCIEFLMLQQQVTTMEKDILSMERSLKTMRNENDASYEQISMNYDLDYVYGLAVNELGMVYPNNNEIITFDKVEESYVRQYADIPQ